LLGMLLQRPEIPFPVQAKIQACVEDRRRVERGRPPPGRHVVGIGAGTVRPYIVAR
jgi:hypothetical protein